MKNIINKINNKLKIHISFWIAAGVFWFLGLGSVFVAVAVSVTAHELAHILTARAFGCKMKRLGISALGESVLIDQLNKLTAWKRAAVYAAGPLCNLLLWGVFSFHEMFGLFNLVLFGFNLLPVFPLDGARLIQLLVGNWAGALKANRLIIKAGRVCCLALMLLGVVQAVLFPPNFTMLFAGFALWRRNRNLQVELSGEFYLAMLNKKECPAKIIYAHQNQTLFDLMEYLTWDHHLIIIMPDDTIITEHSLMEYMTQNDGYENPE